MSLLNALSKIGLVELDESEKAEIEKRSKKDGEISMDDIDALLKAEGIDPDGGAPKKQASPPPRPASSAPAAAPGAGSAGVATGMPFENLYAAANIEASEYAAEKMLKLIDGLRSMDGHTRKTAILAMDSADDAWTIADPVMDAKRKIQALRDHQATVTTQLDGVAARTGEEVQKLDAYQTKATQTIQEQIAKLEAQLQSEIADVAKRKAMLQQELINSQEAATNEHKRVEAEIKRLDEVPKTFESELRKPSVPTGQ